MRIGIDLGGTKIEGIALAEDGKELARFRRPTPRDDYGATLDAIASLVTGIEAAAGARGSVGIGMPGALSPATGLVKNANSVWLNGMPLSRDLEARLGRSLRFANDANCFALSEAVDGAATGRAVVFGVILGTGCGGGIVVDGQVLTGPNAIAGEWGHNPLPWPEGDERPGPPCYCGRTGCIETFLSGPGLAADHRRVTGRDVSAPEIVALAGGVGRNATTHARTGGAGAGSVADNAAPRRDTGAGSVGDMAAPAGVAGAGYALRKDESATVEAEATLARYEQRLARALAGVINVLDPDAIVLGGGLSRIERLYRSVPRLWSGWIFSDRVDTPLLAPVHGDASGVRGAAWLW